jgi:hypothetical protein
MKNKYKNYFKKLGAVGILFFLVKGIIWLFIFLGAGNLLLNLFE